MLISDYLSSKYYNKVPLFVEARAEILPKKGLAFREIWRHQNFILRLTNLLRPFPSTYFSDFKKILSMYTYLIGPSFQ